MKKETKVISKKKEETKKVEPKKVAKPVAKKEETEEKGVKAYHVSKREDGKWQVKLAKGKVAIKLFSTKAEALEFTKKMSENQDAVLRFHASKGAKKGKITKI